MALKGDLIAAELGNLLQMTAMNRRRGVLTVQDRSNPTLRRRFYIEGDRVRPADFVAEPSLALLVAIGRLAYDDYCTARRHAAGFNGDPTGYLRAKGGLDEALEYEWRFAAVREDLLEVFLWRELRFALEENSAAPASDGRPDLKLDEVVMEAARRLDEQERAALILGDARPILRRTSEKPPDGLTDVQRLVFEACDGMCGVREIGLDSGLPRFYVESAAADLLSAGVFEAVPTDELCEIGDRLSAEKRHHDALRVWRTALRSSRLDLELHKRMANVLLETGRPAKACAHWRFVAGAMAAEGRRREALEQYHLAWRILPARFKTLETIVGLLAEERGPRTRDDRIATADAKKLVSVFSDVGESVRALTLAERLRAIDPDDREVLTAAARLNSKLGRREAAAAAWLILAERLAEDGDLRRALETVRTVAAFDPANAKLYELRISDLSRRLADAVRDRGRKRTKVALVATLAILAASYAVYALRAEKALLHVESLESGSAAATDEAARAAADAARWYFLAPAGHRAEAKARALASASASIREDKRNRDEQAVADRTMRRAEAERRLEEARRAVRAGRIGEAAPLFRSAVAAAGGRGNPEAATVESELGEVERYLTEAKQLAAKADELAAADPDRAFDLRVKLLKDYEGAPEADDLRLYVTIDTAPPGAWLIIDDGAVEGRAPLTAPVKSRGALKIEARADGCAPRTTSIPSPPPSRSIRVALERTPSLSLDLREPLSAAAFADDRTAIVSCRNGRVFAADLVLGTTRWSFAPDAIESLRRAPVTAGGTAWCVTESGRGRVFDVKSGAVLATTTTGSDLLTATHQDRIYFTDGAALNRLEADGRTVELCRLPSGRAAAFARGAKEWWIAAGADGLWRLEDGGKLERVSPDAADGVVVGTSGSVRVVRPGVGVFSRNAAGPMQLVFEAADVRGIYAVGSERAVVRFGDRGIALLDGDRTVIRTFLVQDAADSHPVVDLSGGRVAFALASGWLAVLDATTLETTAGRSCDPGAVPALRGGTLLDPRETGRLSMVRER